MEPGSRTITDLIKVAETYALLAVAEALQFSLGQGLARGAAADSCATSLDRAANGEYLAQRLIQVCVRRIWHRPVASNTELKMQRAAAASTTSKMSTPESPRSRSGFSSASLMSAGEAATLRANSPMAAAGLSTRPLAVSGPLLDSGTISVASGPQRRRTAGAELPH